MAIFNWKPKLVLPTVYDDALSYQEILGKVIDALNQMGETGKLVNAVFPNEAPVISVRDNGINIVGKAKIVYMDGTEKDCDIDMTIPLAKGDNVNFAVVDGVVKIFATDTTYTGGSGIVLEGTVVKVNYDEVQRKLTAGEGIVIQGNTISVDPSINNKITEVEGIANTANSNATAAQTTANAAQETANTANSNATAAQNRADSAYNLANTADIASQQNASRIQIIEDTAPQFSLVGTTLTITLPA